MSEIKIIDGKAFIETHVAADFCGVSVQGYINWKKLDDPPPFNSKHKLVPLKELGVWTRTKQTLKRGRGGSGYPYMPDLTEVNKEHAVEMKKEAPETRLKRLQADKVQIELDQMAGKLLPVAEAMEAQELIASRVRTKLMRLPVTMAPLITGLTDPYDVQGKLTDAVYEALEELADGGL